MLITESQISPLPCHMTGFDTKWLISEVISDLCNEVMK